MKFADTNFLLALLSPRDQWHHAAVRVAASLDEPIVTTSWVLSELGNFCAASAKRDAFVRFVRQLEQEPEWQVVSDSDVWFARGLELYAARRDKEWSLTDCISFEVMRELHITEALTWDHHFEQAGFRLIESGARE